MEKRQWISDADYKEGLAIAQLMPGPLAAQLAIYLRYVHFRVRGATLVGLAFVLPSFFMVAALGALYQAFGGLTWMQAVFYGVGSCVIGIIAMSAWKLTSKNIGKDKVLGAIFFVSAVTTVVTQSEEVWLFLGAGVLVWLVRARPKLGSTGTLQATAAPLAAAFSLQAVDWHKLAQIGTYFAYAGTFVFGSGLAIVPFLYAGALYYTEGGSRKTLKYVDAPVARGVPHTLRVEFAANRIGVWLGGKRYIDWRDEHIAGAGAVGVWTKADSVTAFTEFRYGSAAR